MNPKSAPALGAGSRCWLLAGCAACRPINRRRPLRWRATPPATRSRRRLPPTSRSDRRSRWSTARWTRSGGARWARGARCLVDEALRASPTLEAAPGRADPVARAARGPGRIDAAGRRWTWASAPSASRSAPAPRACRATRASSASTAPASACATASTSAAASTAACARWPHAPRRQHELAAARHALAANLATAAITRARLAAQIDAQTAILRTQEELVRLAQVRTRLGQAAPDEVSALTAQAELTRAGLPPLHKSLQQTEHLLAVLAGRAPAQGVPAFTLADFALARSPARDRAVRVGSSAAGHPGRRSRAAGGARRTGRGLSRASTRGST
jgi:outer membrane protein TolC